MIVIIDNYDSFTYNLYQYVGEINPEVEVYRNDKLTVRELEAKSPSHIIISPGPGFPHSAGISIDVIQKMGKHTPILGVCLGHQAIAEAYGGKTVHADRLMHGKTSNISLKFICPLFEGLPEIITVGRYHSLVVSRENLPEELEITAQTDEHDIMALMHKTNPVYGIQFHPESVLTLFGKKIIENFLSM